MQARETVSAIAQDVPLTPRHSAGLVGMWEKEDVGRAGIEWYFTGRQDLGRKPVSRRQRPLHDFGLLAEKQFGRIRLFVNRVNLTSVRQTRWDPLLDRRERRTARRRLGTRLRGAHINGGLPVRF